MYQNLCSNKNFNNMKKIEINQMENVHGGGGISCAIAVASWGLAYAGLVTATGGVGLIIAAASYSLAPVGAALSCLT
jgi:hypothetical protein